MRPLGGIFSLIPLAVVAYSTILTPFSGQEAPHLARALWREVRAVPRVPARAAQVGPGAAPARQPRDVRLRPLREGAQ